MSGVLCPKVMKSFSLKITRWAVSLCVFITAVPLIKMFAWGEGESGGHVLRETTSRGLGFPSRTSERGGEGACVQEGGGEGDVCVYYCSTYYKDVRVVGPVRNPVL